MQTDNPIATLQDLAEAGDFGAAIELCERLLEDRRDDRGFWKLQIALLYFLDEENRLRWDQAPRYAGEAVYADPANPDAHFWYGYIKSMLQNDDEFGRRQFELCFDLHPQHAYAHLGMAVMNLPPEETKTHLDRVLEVQPANYRALLLLAKACQSMGREAEAQDALEALLRNRPYVEASCGIMNGYINTVLNQSTSAERRITEAQIRLSKLRNAS
jgi:tetratricopeptide (TPR) repeat protein